MIAHDEAVRQAHARLVKAAERLLAGHKDSASVAEARAFFVACVSSYGDARRIASRQAYRNLIGNIEAHDELSQLAERVLLRDEAGA